MIANSKLHIVLGAAFAASIAVLACCASEFSTIQSSKPSGKVALVRVPDRGIQPQVARDAKGVVHMIYFRGAPAHGDIYYTRTQDGTRFQRALRVNSRPESAIAVGNIRGAHLALGVNGRPHVAWMGSSKAKKKAREVPMLYTRLADDGAAFEPERNVIQSAFGLDGGGSVAADGNGRVHVAWHAPAPGAKGEENRRVWLARSTDEGKTFARESPVSASATGVCGCCGMRALGDRRGNLFLLYRSATDEVNRDTYLLVSPGETGKFAGQRLQEWKIATCPMSSFSLAETGRAMLAAWETDGQVYFMRLEGDKRTKPIAAPGSAKGRKHPVVAANADGETILVWTEGMGWNRGGAVAWQVFDKAGRPTDENGRIDGVPVWSLVAAFATADDRFIVVY